MRRLIPAQATLIAAHEAGRRPALPVGAAEILEYLMDQHDLTRADLAALLGTASRVSEVLNGKKQLSLKQVQRLRDRFQIPADVLIPFPDARPARDAA